MLRISLDEYRRRINALQTRIQTSELDLFIASESDSIYYLTGATYEPLERPFFLLVAPEVPPRLLVPQLEHQHMKKASTVPSQDILTYWEYPATAGRGWPDRLRDLIGKAKSIGIEPGLRSEIAIELSAYGPRVVLLVEELRLLKSEAEIAMVRRAARYADFAVERLLARSYFLNPA